jgi:hypothetical protein
MNNKDEYEYCKKNPTYFINKYLNLNSTYINSPFNGVLYDYQEALIDHYHTNNFSICKAPRQSGKTITGLAYMLHYNVFNENKNSGIVRRSSSDTLQRLKNMYLALPEWFKGAGGLLCDDDDKIIFNNGCIISNIIKTESHIKSIFKKLDFLYLDEFAFTDEKIAKLIVDNIFISLPEKVIASSTPFHSKVYDIDEDGYVIERFNQFYKLWIGNKFSSFSVDWYELHGSSEEKKKEIIRNIGVSAWDVEYECQFKSITNYKGRPFHTKKLTKDELLLAGILLNEHLSPHYQRAIRERLGYPSDKELNEIQ